MHRVSSVNFQHVQL